MTDRVVWPAWGQAAIAVRHALLTGDGPRAFASIGALDEAHRIEVLLGAAIRDRTDDFAAVRAWYAGDLRELCARLAQPPDTALDDVAIGLIVARRVDEQWRPDGRPAGSAPNPAALNPAALNPAALNPAALNPGALDPSALNLSALESTCAALAVGVGGMSLLSGFAGYFLHPAVHQYYTEGTIHALGVRPLLILAGTPAMRPDRQRE